MVCEIFLLLHFKSGKISVIIFFGPLLMELHFLFMNAYASNTKFGRPPICAYLCSIFGLFSSDQVTDFFGRYLFQLQKLTTV